MDVKEMLLSMGNRLPTFVSKRLQSDSLLTKVARPVVNRIAPNEPRVVTVMNGAAAGLKLYIYPRHEKYYWTGLHEPHVQQAIQQNLREGDVFWDIGAHIGLFSLIASQAVGDSGTVHAFEPMTDNRNRLQRSIEANKKRNIRIHAEALGKSSGMAKLQRHESSLMWSLTENGSTGASQEVICRTLDDIFETEGRPSLVKIDAEGFELDVLQGGLSLLHGHTPKLIVEFTDDARLHEARKLLPNYGFELLDANHWLLKPLMFQGAESLRGGS